MSYGGTDGVYTNTFVYEQNPECIVCSPAAARRKVHTPTRSPIQPPLQPQPQS